MNSLESMDKFTKDDVKKNNHYIITSSKHRTHPYEWSQGIFQRFKPISGEFPIGNNFFGDQLCVNNQTGRGYYANPCGFWDKTENQFDSGTIHDNKEMPGSLFPTGNTKSFNVMSNPNRISVFGYSRIGEEFK